MRRIVNSSLSLILSNNLRYTVVDRNNFVIQNSTASEVELGVESMVKLTLGFATASIIAHVSPVHSRSFVCGPNPRLASDWPPLLAI